MRYLCSVRVSRRRLRIVSSAALAATLLILVTTTSLARAQSATECGSSPYDCAVAQVQRQDFATAIRTLQPILAQTPKDLRVLNLLGIALTGAGRPEDANARFREALALNPRFVPALKNLAVNEYTLGRHADAQHHFQAVLELAPDDEIAHVHLGEIEFERKQYRAALAHYEKSAARVAQNPRWILHHATCLLDQNLKPDAIALLDRLPAGDGAARFDAAVVLGRYGAHPEAARFFEAARRSGYKDAYAAGYNQTLMLIEAEDYDAAIRVAGELFAQGFKPAELYNLVSRAYARVDRIKDAYDALREATRLEPAVAEHYIDMAMLCLEHENYDLGLEIVDVGLKHRPDSSMLYLQRGVVLAMKGAVEQAEQEFSRASQAAPNDPAPYVALAMVWMQRGQTPRAVELLRTRARASSAQSVIHYALGIALLRSGAAPDDEIGTEALEAFRAAVRLQPAFAQAQSELGKLLLRRGDVTGAIAHLERATALEPENTSPAYVLSQAYRRSGQTARAQELLARVSRLNAQERGDDPDPDLRRAVFRIVREGARVSPTAPAGAAEAGDHKSPELSAAGRSKESVSASTTAAAACAAAGDLDGAISRLREAVDATPASAEARSQLAVTLWNRYQRAGGRRDRKDLDDAVTVLLPAVEQDAGEPQFRLVLGQLYAEQQNFAPAVEHLERAASLAPENPEYPYNLGLALRLRGDLDAAEAQFRAALAKDSNHALARRSLGLVLRQKGNTAGAASELRRAVAQAPDDAQAHYLLGSVLLKLAETVNAIVELREAARLDPSLTEARVMLAQALARQGQKEEARQEQAAVERINSEKAALGRTLVLLDSSGALLAKGDVAGAIAQRREAVAASVGFAEAHYELGVALVAAEGSRAEAEAAFRQAIALDERHARAHAALATLLASRGDESGAHAARMRAAELAPCSLASR
jgi:tetratricopeptide (TPR) repeat protein